MSGVKASENKPPVSLIPREAILEEARSFGYGAGKYGTFGFRAGVDYRKLIDAAMRHLLAIADGEDVDEESQCLHAAAVRANMGMLIYLMKHKPEFDDRFKK